MTIMIQSWLPLKSDGPMRASIGPMGKKYLLYGEIAMPQWMTDQLTNILQVKDHNTIKQALIPVIAATEDAASILFTAEKNSRACSMQKMEEGNLAWGDST